MAVFPLHAWLPDTHTVAPMPVTIMLAAAMLSMGTYGIIRFPISLFGTEALVAFSIPLMVAGVVSQIYGALMAMAESDVKRIVAYSSVSQMGYILFGIGTLTHDGLAGATLHVIYHAIVKALLFMAVGILIAASGKRHLAKLTGMGGIAPGATAGLIIGVLAIAATPPLCIFDSEWLIFSGAFQTGRTALVITALLGSLLTVAYAFRLGGLIAFGTRPAGLHRQGVPKAMLAPTVFLAVLAIVEGVFPAPLLAWIEHEVSMLLRGLP
jgi:NADH-quinone oxidoreductase subunit M